MRDIIDLDRYPIDAPQCADCRSLVADCKARLDENGLFNLPGFMRPRAIEDTVASLAPTLATSAFAHIRRHNIYFKPSVDGLADDHPALRRFETANRTICADQMADSALIALYEWPAFAAFLAAVMDRPALFVMDDPLARANVMGYSEGQALNWHFDRSEFTTTLLLQAAQGGGAFEYAKDLRGDDDPNYACVADLIDGRHPTTVMPLAPGTVNVFRGRNTAHRVTPVQGPQDRIIAVFSYYDRPGVTFSDAERMGFYGRTG